MHQLESLAIKVHRLIEEQTNAAIESFKINLDSKPDHDIYLRQQIDSMGQLIRMSDMI
jgi:hypothetical protein